MQNLGLGQYRLRVDALARHATYAERCAIHIYGISESPRQTIPERSRDRKAQVPPNIGQLIGPVGRANTAAPVLLFEYKHTVLALRVTGGKPSTRLPPGDLEDQPLNEILYFMMKIYDCRHPISHSELYFINNVQPAVNRQPGFRRGIRRPSIHAKSGEMPCSLARVTEMGM